MSMCSFKDMPDMSTQQLIIGKPFGERQIQIYTQAHHGRNHRHDRERNDRNDYFDLARGMKRKRVTSSEGSGNGYNNDDWAEGLHREIERQQLRQFRIQRNRREQGLSPVRTVSGAPVYMPILRTAQEEALRIVNDISPNLDEESSVS
ncbi:MAG: hypothetical protein EZS28_032857 [Streblomastix strix]|uniref:Uncharacterized protein n=1 Tax=Streblomastix strix TaxID=222440 RepID=A0A5J4ULU2_9EUKA|nr:MAG: hypothetical protein EZS28_032857 [Streblomastix strix]